MLVINDSKSRLNRRQLLTIGGLGMGSLSLASLLGVKAQAAELSNAVRNKSVVFLFQQGGPSQLETFDPKPLAPDSIRTVCDVIPTSIPGVHCSEYFPKLARLASQFTIVRNYQTLNGGHNIQPIVGPHSLQASIPVHYSRVVGTTHAQTGMPTSAILFPQAVSEDVPRGSARGNLAETGAFGSGYAPPAPCKVR